MRVIPPRKAAPSIVDRAGISCTSGVLVLDAGMLSVRCGHTVVIDAKREKGGLTMADSPNDIPPVFITEMNILARKGKLSISVKAECMPDVSNELKLRWLSKTVSWLEENGFEEKDVPRSFGNGARSNKPAREYIKAICTCNGRMYITGKGDAACEKYSERPDYKHLYIRKGDLDRAV